MTGRPTLHLIEIYLLKIFTQACLNPRISGSLLPRRRDSLRLVRRLVLPGDGRADGAQMHLQGRGGFHHGELIRLIRFFDLEIIHSINLDIYTGYRIL